MIDDNGGGGKAMKAAVAPSISQIREIISSTLNDQILPMVPSFGFDHVEQTVHRQ